MRSRDVANLFGAVNVGTKIVIVSSHLREAIARAPFVPEIHSVTLAAN
jgi:hypothetical protein